jgi:MFS family permease
MPAEPADLDPRRWRALPVLLIGSFLSFLDVFIVNIALPAMRDDLSASSAQLQLVVAGYGVGFAVSLITGVGWATSMAASVYSSGACRASRWLRYCAAWRSTRRCWLSCASRRPWRPRC